MNISPLGFTRKKSALGVTTGFASPMMRAIRNAMVMLSVSGFFPAIALPQASPSKPVVVQPGAPGEPTKTLPSSTHAALLPRSVADVEFMQGMIMHHQQAVEMTAMIESHTQNKELRSLGARISSSQTDEIKFMKRWLAARQETVP